MSMSRNQFSFGKRLWARILQSRTRKQRRRSQRRPALECLENRQLLASGYGIVSGTVWNDLNGNGARDAGESALSGAQVFADSNNNGKLDRGESSAITGRGGSYRLMAPAGNCTVREVSVSGWQVTSPSSGAHTVTVAAGKTVTGKNFGNQRSAGTVSGTVWNDLDGDGTRDAGESGLSGWQVYADADGDSKYDRGESVATTGRDGTYKLTLSAGTYTIREVAQTNWTATAPNAGSWSVTVATGTTSPGNDFGNQPTTTTTPATGAFDITLSTTGLTAAEQAIAEQAAARWEAVIVGDLPDVKYHGQTIDDVLINITVSSIDGQGNVVAESGPEGERSGSSLPYVGTVYVDRSDLSSLESDSELLDVLTHEMGHVLGLGTIWDTKGLLSGTRSNPLFTGIQATAAYNKLFGTSASGVPVENTGGSGTALAHWRESVFVNELMVGTIQSGGMPLSTVTVASMADLGYTVNMAAAESYTVPSISTATGTTSTSPGTSGGYWTSPGGSYGGHFGGWGRPWSVAESGRSSGTDAGSLPGCQTVVATGDATDGSAGSWSYLVNRVGTVAEEQSSSGDTDSTSGFQVAGRTSASSAGPVLPGNASHALRRDGLAAVDLAFQTVEGWWEV